ncbi:MAG: class I adenylate cyclase [Candidatus Tectomicrobia bacterium]|uniref:Class I adenylate cyclase n=1 Tax=Tectimicrobiota bacterium TaxID=2528274 RepID=A0A932GP04_UNCTE|nr:class I adenylate cyclase [Candidatus Tectomicrobia bacterium]
MEQEILKNRRAFSFYNRRRLDQLFSALQEQDACILGALPFLLQVNIKKLPGYIEAKEVPCGTYDFSWTKEAQTAVRKLFPDFPLERLSSAHLFPRRSAIVMLALIGSAGSIAQTEKSDLDFWVCIEERSLGAAALALLKERLKALEQWIWQTSQTEMHFFITDIEKVQKNDFGEAGLESSGTALGKLLKEEFYRTSIVLAGKTPLWWITPTRADDETYEEFKQAVRASNELDPQDYVDLGNLSEITWDEFFGASLWQMNKAMASPFKSVLKMALLDACMDPENESGLLCDDLKQSVFSLSTSDRHLDPYILLFDHILEYNQKKQRPEVVDLLRTCFYIKVGVRLSPLDFSKKLSSRKREILAEYVKSWGWSLERVETLNDYANWPFEKTLALGKEVHQFLLSTYQTLSDRLKEKPDLTAKISATDLTLLGRKLASLYSKKPGKVEVIKQAVEEGLELEALTLYTSYESDSKRGEWRVYRGMVPREELLDERGKGKLLRRSRNLLEILIWLVHNRLYTPATTLHMIPNGSPITLNDLKEILREMSDFFPPIDLSQLAKKDLLSESRIDKVMVVANLLAQRWATHLSDLGILYRTSWGEQFCESYASQAGIQKAQEYVVEAARKQPASTCYRLWVPRGEGYKTLAPSLAERLKKRLPKAYAAN